MQFISRSRIFRKFAFRLIYPSANTLSISRRPRRKYLSPASEVYFPIKSILPHARSPFLANSEYLLNCILHFGVGENKRESKKVLANAIASGYQFSNSSQVGVSPSAIMVLFLGLFCPLDTVSTNKREIETEGRKRNNTVIVYRMRQSQ